MADIGNWFKYPHFCTCKSWLEGDWILFHLYNRVFEADQVKPRHLKLSLLSSAFLFSFQRDVCSYNVNK